VLLGTIKVPTWNPTDGERAGQTLTRLEVTAAVVAASLQRATATITEAPRSENQVWSEAPLAGEEQQPAP
jgi:hypothetical protein